MHVVTISATFGAKGSLIGPAVAEILDVPFLDRAIPTTVAAEIGCSIDEVMAHDDRAEHGIGRILSNAARLPNVTLGGMDVYLPDPQRRIYAGEDFVAHTEQVIRSTAREQGGVFLGRAGMLVLRDFPGALHVRLDGPEERRRVQAARLTGVLDGEARDRLQENDRARTAYVKHFYRADWADPKHYHLIIDSTVLSVDASVDIIARAARDLTVRE